MNFIKMYGSLISRILLSAIFILAGIGKITGFAGTVVYINSVGLPMPAVLAILAIIVELGGGILLLLGYYTKIASGALFVFTLLAALFFHLNFGDPMQQAMFLKNLAIMGGMLMLFVHGAGRVSCDMKRGTGTPEVSVLM
ncbi:DoxX family protein [bacterium]|nr:DoxX family protein [bacterium]